MDINLEYLIHNRDRFRDSYSKRLYGIIFLCYYNLFTFMSKLYAISIYVYGQPAQDLPIPDSKRMFTNDTALIKTFDLDPYTLDLAINPKIPIAGQITSFAFNLLDKNNKTWLWHSDLQISIADSSGNPIAIFPNNHGHGSLIEFKYAFPKEDTYKIDLIFGQQTGSPNYMKGPKVVGEATFNLTVNGQKQQLTQPIPNDGNVKDISINVSSFKFVPNVIEVNRGDLVRLHFQTAQDDLNLYNGHGFGIENYNVNVFLIKGTQQEVQFIDDKPGSFTFRCTSFCAPPEAAMETHFNMIGRLIVH